MPSLSEHESPNLEVNVARERRLKLRSLSLGRLFNIALSSGATQDDIEGTLDRDDLVELIISLEEIPKEHGRRPLGDSGTQSRRSVPYNCEEHDHQPLGSSGTQRRRSVRHSGQGQSSIATNAWNFRRVSTRQDANTSDLKSDGEIRMALQEMRRVIKKELNHSLKLFTEDLRLLVAEALKGANMATYSKPKGERYTASPCRPLPSMFSDVNELGLTQDWSEKFSGKSSGKFGFRSISDKDDASPGSGKRKTQPKLSESAKSFQSAVCRILSDDDDDDDVEDEDKEQLFDAVAQKNIDVVAQLLEDGAQPNAVLAKYTKNGTSKQYLDCSLLAVAVMTNSIDVVELLVEFDASLESRYGFLAGSLQMPWSGTAIFAAIPGGSLEMVRELVELEADPHECSSNRANLVWQACYFGHSQILVYLLHLGVDHNIAAQSQDFEGVSYSPLHIAAIRDHFGVMEKLISAKADIDSVNEEGKTPLLIAIVQKHAASVRMLVAAGANLVKDSVKTDQLAGRPLDVLLQMSNNVLLQSAALGLRDQEKQVAELRISDLLEFLASPLSRREILQCIFKRRKLQYWAAIDGIMEVEAAYLRKHLMLHGGQTFKFLNVACAKHNHATMQKNVKKRCEPDSDIASFLKTLAPQSMHSRWISQFCFERHSMMAIHTYEAVVPSFHFDLHVLKVISDASYYEAFFNAKGCQAILQNAWSDVWHYSLFYGVMNLGLLVVFAVLAALYHTPCWGNSSCRNEKLDRVVTIVAAAGIPCWSAKFVRELLIIAAHIKYGWISSLFRRLVTYYHCIIISTDGLILFASLSQDWQHSTDFTLRLLFSISCLDKWMRLIYDATSVRKIGLPIMPILFTICDIGPFAILFCTCIAAFTTALFALDLKHELWVDTFISVFLFGSVAEPSFLRYAAHASHANETSRIMLRLAFAASTFFVAITLMNCFIAAMTTSYTIGSNNKQKLYQSRLAREVWKNTAARKTFWRLRRALCSRRRNKRNKSQFLWYAVEIDE